MSVIVPIFGPARALERVMASLDAQTLPKHDFEVILVDDGSPDDAFAQAQQLASGRPNVRAMRIAHSGWPSRPRNVGIERARGEYVLFMDHDDSLYPDGLRRATEYAREHHADVLAIKESKTNDVWWGMDAVADGNIANAVHDGGIDRLQPMMPHKLYRRELLLDHDIRFPEGSRVLWEDVFVNVAAYRHARVVSVLADTPVYLWHGGETNSSHTFDARRPEFWDRLEDVLQFITATLDGDDHREARLATLAWEVGFRVIHRCVLLVGDPAASDEASRRWGLRRARQLLNRYTSDHVYALLSRHQKAMLHLIHAGGMDQIVAARSADQALSGTVTTDRIEWTADGLEFDVLARWGPKKPSATAFRRESGRIVRAVDQGVQRILPPELLDVTEDAESMTARVALRNRTEHVTWELPLENDAAGYVSRDGALCLERRGRGRISMQSGADGRPLDPAVWDLRVKSDWLGMQRRGPLLYSGPPAPVLLGGAGVTAYANNARGLSLDLAQRLRTFALDARPRLGPAGPAAAFRATLDNITILGDGEVDASMLVALADDVTADDSDGSAAPQNVEHLAAGQGLNARVIASGGVARLEGTATLAPGRYRLYTRLDGRLHRTKLRLAVDENGQLDFE